MSSIVVDLENTSTTLSIPNEPIYIAHTNNELDHVRDNTGNSKNGLTLTIPKGR
jgi:hypothetical protein